MIINLPKFLFSLYIISLGFYTLYNPGGTFPFCLLFSFFLFFNLIFQLNNPSKILFPKISIIDLLLFIFLFISVLSVVLNIETKLNYNHLITHFVVILLYYYNIRIFINCNKTIISSKFLINVIILTFFVIFTTVIFDQSLLFFGINMANYLPMETSNTLVGEGFFSRARGFFVEPTDLALGINAIGPIIIVYLYKNKSIIYFIFTLLSYFIILILTRSTAGFVEFFIGLIISFLFYLFDLLNRDKIKLVIKKKTLQIFLFTFSSLFILYLILIEPILTAFEEATKKLNLNGSEKSDIRMTFWDDSFNLFYNSSNIFTGLGTGYSTLNQKTFNWYLTVLIENGIFGIIIVFLVFLFSYLKLYKINSSIKYGLLISFTSTILHLSTQTGFYYGFIWLLLVFIQIDWSFLEKQQS